MKSPSTTPPPVDPALVQAQEDAKLAKNKQIQASLSDDFLNMQRQFGARSAISGAGMMAPLSGGVVK